MQRNDNDNDNADESMTAHRPRGGCDKIREVRN